MTNPTRQPTLDRLTRRLSSLIGAATEALKMSTDPAVVDAWYEEVARQLRRYTLAAYLSGSGQAGAFYSRQLQLTDTQRDVVTSYTQTQLDYLAAFRDEIKAAEEWSNGWSSRAQMYAESIKAPWWAGNTRAWALPAMPGDGTTQCLTNCRCSWRVDELDGDGNADAYWIVQDGERCQTCIERGSQWNPLQIRNGEIL